MAGVNILLLKLLNNSRETMNAIPSCSRNATGIRLSEPRDTASIIPRADTTFPEDAIPFFIAVSLSLLADSSLILDIMNTV